MRFRWLVWLWCIATTLAAPVELVPPGLRDATQPQVTVASGGAIHVVFGKGKTVYHTKSTDGLEFSEPVKVGDLEKLALGKRRGPRVVASGDVLLVTAISHADGNLHSWTSSDEGKTWQEGAAINTANSSAREGLQALAGNGRGRVVVVWPDSRAGGMEVWSRESRDGGKS